MPINQPSNQIKLTNVSTVRIKRGKKRFELACYKNKVLDHRNNLEPDLDEVLQTPQIFSNVSKGTLASSSDLATCFPGMKTEEIILEILKKGELQVGEKEREAVLGKLEREVVGIVAERCVDPGTKRVYTPTMIEKALLEMREKRLGGWNGVGPSKSAKAWALEAIRALVEAQVIPIARARMRVRVVLPAAIYKKLKAQVVGYFEVLEGEEFLGAQEGWEATGLVEPGTFRVLGDLVGGETKGKGRVEVLEMADVREGEGDGGEAS
ncbi:SBDS protein C-terminal domain-containing protein [Peziza echinospora]|nr:SBDS protein C-terminal domain-containing protein [Peziza echinospora]